MKLGVLFSGGKDSTFALDWALKHHEPAVLITIESQNPESYMYHVPNIRWTKKQAKVIGLPQIYLKTRGQKEQELTELKHALQQAKKEFKVKGIVSGAIFSNYQKSRIDSLARELNLKSFSPLWGKSPERLWEEMLFADWKVIISAVAVGGLGQEWLGKKIGWKEYEQLCNLHQVCYVCTGGEGGEFETFVLDTPFFKKRIEVLDGIKHWDGSAGWFEIKKIRLVRKQY